MTRNKIHGINETPFAIFERSMSYQYSNYLDLFNKLNSKSHEQKQKSQFLIISSIILS